MAGRPEGLPDGLPEGRPDGLPEGLPEGRPDDLPEGRLGQFSSLVIVKFQTAGRPDGRLSRFSSLFMALKTPGGSFGSSRW